MIDHSKLIMGEKNFLFQNEDILYVVDRVHYWLSPDITFSSKGSGLVQGMWEKV